MNNENIIGIDLGTTMSVISKLNEIGDTDIISTIDGHRLTPSVIFFHEAKEVFVGEEAKNSLPAYPHRVAREFKREMHNPDYRFEVDNNSYTGAELSAFVLKKLIKDASQQIGEIKKAVISVPSYFGDYERSATLEAGRFAGLEEINIINEPTAAALF